MLNAIIEWSLKNRFFVLVGTALVAGMGVYAALRLPIDAIPDLTNVQVQVITEAPALSPLEVESLLSFPVESAMSGLPDVEQIRSVSKFGISVVTIVFHEGTDILRARQLVSERIPRAAEAIPQNYGTPGLGPIATALGEVFQFQVKAEPGSSVTAMELRSILDWFVSYQLRKVPGVTEINAHGGELKTYQVEVDPDKLGEYHLSITDLFRALQSNNANAGGGYLVHEGEARYIRGVSQARSTDDIASIVVDERDGVPVTVGSVAKVHPAPMIRSGLATRDGQGEAVIGLVMMLIGQNGRRVVEDVKVEIAELQKSLPPGVTIEALYDRSHLIHDTLDTVMHNLAEGGVLVILVLLAMLGNLRGGIIVALAIPLSMLFAADVMYLTGVSASLMSLGAIDFGLIVDSSVIMMENCVSHLSHADKRRNSIDVVREAAFEVRKPVVFGVAIITIVHLPLLALEGVEGKMFQPMALTVVFALIGSLILSLTATPVLASMILKPGTSEVETLPVRVSKFIYRPFLAFSLNHPFIVSGLSVLAFAATMPIAMSLGGEFIPRLDEGDVQVVVTRPPSASLSESMEDAARVEKALKAAMPDQIESVVCRTGRPEIGIDPAGVNQTDVFIFLKKPQETYVDLALKPLHPILALFQGGDHGPTKAELIREMEKIFRREIPGATFNFGQPIEIRFNEMLAGVRADLGIGVFGDDLDVLQDKVNEIAAAIGVIPGAADVRAQVLGGLPFMRVQVNRENIARYGINASAILDVVSALGGKVVGQVIENQRTFALQVRFEPSARDDLDSIQRLKIADPVGRMIPLTELAEFHQEDGAFEIWRKNRQRRAMVQANVRDRDLATFVADAQKAVASKVELPRGYFLEWGGTFQNLQSATQRLTIVVPVALVLIFLLLYGTFQSVKLGSLIFLSVPLGAMGGILALWLRDMNLSISAGVGFIALSGVAVLDGLVIVSAIRQRVEAGVPMREAVAGASMSRLRPVLMTALVASLGFIPMAFSTGSGADVQRPLATVVIGGLITSTALKLLLIPATYAWFDPGAPRRDDEDGTDPDDDGSSPTDEGGEDNVEGSPAH